MKRFIDDRGRLFGLISFIDVIVLIAVVILAIASFTGISEIDNPIVAARTVPVTYDVKISVVRQMTVDMLRIGDHIYNESDAYIGTVVGISVTEAEVLEALLDGTFVMGKAHERYDVVLTIEAQCSFNNGRYYADRVFELNTNAEYRINTKYVATNGTILSISAG